MFKGIVQKLCKADYQPIQDKINSATIVNYCTVRNRSRITHQIWY